MFKQRKSLVWVAVLVCAMAFSAVAAANTVSEVTYTIRGFSFEGPDQIPAGMTKINIVNPGEHGHMVALLSFADGRNVGDFFAAMGQLLSDPTATIPRWVNFYGGIAVGPGQSTSYTTFIGPDTYAMISLGADEQGPFAARGLVKMIGAAAPSLPADVIVRTNDFRFDVVGSFKAGSQVVKLENVGREPHEFIVVPLPPGVPLEHILHAMEAEPVEPDFGSMNGFWVVSPGTTAYFTLNLAPGRYGVFCFLPDSGGPHVMQGMFLDFTVE